MVDVRVPIIEMPKQPPKEDRNTRKLDTETAERVQKGYKACSEILQLTANEPTIGLFHVSDHIRRATPRVVEARKEIRKFPLKDVAYDMDFSLLHVKGLHELQTFSSIQEMLQKSIEISQQLVGKDQKLPPAPMSPYRGKSNTPTKSTELQKSGSQNEIPTSPTTPVAPQVTATYTSLEQDLMSNKPPAKETGFTLKPKQF